MKSNRFRTLIHFFISILMIMVTEMLLRPLMQTVLLPAIWKGYGIDVPKNWDLGRTQMFLLESASIVIMILWLLSLIVPEILRTGLYQAGTYVEGMVHAFVPQMNGRLWNHEMLPTNALQLFSISLLMIFLQLLPYFIASLYFTGYVVVEGRRVRNEAKRQQEELDRERNLMLSNIAHDIRNPITTISGYAQALEEGVVTDAMKQAEYLRAIRKKSDRVELLISLLFDYAKLNSGGFSLNREMLDFSEFLRQNAANLYSDAEEAGMELIPEIPSRQINCNVDRIQFSRVITNLVNNAVKYNPKGTKILIRFTEGESIWNDDVLLIADTGEKIAKETADRLFEPFSRGDTSRPTDGGSGLGLSIVKRIVELHGCEIVFRTDIRGYTKGFEIRMPKQD